MKIIQRSLWQDKKLVPLHTCKYIAWFLVTWRVNKWWFAPEFMLWLFWKVWKWYDVTDLWWLLSHILVITLILSCLVPPSLSATNTLLWSQHTLICLYLDVLELASIILRMYVWIHAWTRFAHTRMSTSSETQL